MAEYLVLAENITFKNNKLSCINIYDRLATVAMPAEFRFDLAILCGPNWKKGEHKLKIKAVASSGKELTIGELSVNIPQEDFVYNAFANDCKMIMDYSVESLTIVVYDNNKEIIRRKYPVVSMLVPQKQAKPAEVKAVAEKKTKDEVKTKKKQNRKK